MRTTAAAVCWCRARPRHPMTTCFTAAGGVQATWDPATRAPTSAPAGGESPATPRAPRRAPRPDRARSRVDDGGLERLRCQRGLHGAERESADCWSTGHPMEHSIQFFDLSLGESIENIVRWAPSGPARPSVITASTWQPAGRPWWIYSKSPLSSVTYTNTETSVPGCRSARLPAPSRCSDPSDPITRSPSCPSGLPTGVHRADVTVSHTLYNTPRRCTPT
jgi:hypothetical protein